MPAILILFLIGSLAGTWMVSGVVPMLIYYGLEILHPKIFLFAAVIICAVVSIYRQLMVDCCNHRRSTAGYRKALWASMRP
jgi:Na+/H+ antiporter NhaC